MDEEDGAGGDTSLWTNSKKEGGVFVGLLIVVIGFFYL